MPQDRRPAKRTRPSSQGAQGGLQPPAALKHHEEFWLDDGNIILVAQDVAFRIYRCLLAAQSTVFADMFASASPSSDECMDGCPVVHVSDSSEDLAHLLRVLLPGSRRLYVSYSLA